ncbi:DMT family transporter [Lacibacterium aquatile]|uniref:DMT family transporter n=1 Tax=Lacibacterium aquatile TaxID=1168082 RepID=A0ABW5DK24_9PROT
MGQVWVMRGMGLAMFCIAPLLFSGNMIIARLVVDDVPPVTLAFGRWLVAALVLAPFAWSELRAHWPRIRAQAPLLGLLAFLGAGVAIAPQYMAVHHTSAGNVALIFAATPVLVLLLERIGWGVAIQRRALIGIAIAVLGLAVAVFRGDLTAVGRFTLNPGDLLVLAAATGWAGYTALLKHHPVALPWKAYLLVLAGGGALLLAPFAVLEAGNPLAVLSDAGALLPVVVLALVASIGAYRLYSCVVGRFGAARASMAMYLVPFYTLGLAAVFLGEGLAPFHATSLALTLLGVLVATMPIRISKPLDTTPAGVL